MSNELKVDQVVEGEVTGLQPYGAFIAIDDETIGLVHISEVTHGFVKDIHEHLKVGETVKVKVLSIDEDANKISLSIRATEAPPKKKQVKKAPKQTSFDNNQGQNEGFNSLKDKLEEWIAQSSDREKAFKK